MLKVGAYLLPEIEARSDLGKRVRRHYLERREKNRARRKH